MSTAEQDSGSAGGPTVRRMLLGAQLRRLREAKGVSREEAGWAIRASESKISRMELGRVGFKERDVADLLTLYGVADDDERDALLTLAQRGQHARLVAAVRRPAAELVSVLPGPGGGGGAHPHLRGPVRPGPAADRRVRPCRHPARVRRRGRRGDRPPRRPADGPQAVLTRPDPPQLWAVIDEAVLRRPIGGPAVMRAQIEALMEASSLPNVRLQVIPFLAGGHAAAGGAFTILRFPDQDLPDVVYIEHLTSALYLDKREDVDRYAEAWDGCSSRPNRLTRTQEILYGILDDLSGA